jgi:phosphoglycolate phosphatase-like HAD superfamily hydrolase
VRTLVLWDVDHTLVDIGGLSPEFYARAFEQVTGRALEHMAPMAGQTDWAIAGEILRLHGESESLETVFCTAVAEQYVAHEQLVRERGRVLDGAREALAALTGRADVVQSVLTGNMVPIAVTKLTALGLIDYLDMSVGAFGMDDKVRARLVGAAQGRAEEKYGEVFTKATTVLIGDTPNDVAAGRDGGARVVAVATGMSDRETLADTGPEVVLDDLRDTAAVVAAILGTGQR